MPLNPQPSTLDPKLGKIPKERNLWRRGHDPQIPVGLSTPCIRENKTKPRHFCSFSRNLDFPDCQTTSPTCCSFSRNFVFADCPISQEIPETRKRKSPKPFSSPPTSNLEPRIAHSHKTPNPKRRISSLESPTP
jgi:hypothetical protein